MSVLVIELASSEIEACSDWLFQLGATAIEERPDPDDAARVVLVVGFTSDDAALHARSLLTERWPCRLESTGDEETWRDEWLKWIEPVEVAGFVVHAPWHDPATWRSDAATLSIDPGLAFGSGHHPTTQLALGSLVDADVAGLRVIDVGCGTAILSIAAAKLGAASVLGVDLNYDILAAAEANVEANGVSATVEVRTENIVSLPGRFDVAVANIVIGDLVPIVPAIAERADLTIISGFLDDQFERVLANVDARVIDRRALDGWGCATLVTDE